MGGSNWLLPGLFKYQGESISTASDGSVSTERIGLKAGDRDIRGDQAELFSLSDEYLIFRKNFLTMSRLTTFILYVGVVLRYPIIGFVASPHLFAAKVGFHRYNGRRIKIVRREDILDHLR